MKRRRRADGHSWILDGSVIALLSAEGVYALQVVQRYPEAPSSAARVVVAVAVGVLASSLQFGHALNAHSRCSVAAVAFVVVAVGGGVVAVAQIHTYLSLVQKYGWNWIQQRGSVLLVGLHQNP